MKQEHKLAKAAAISAWARHPIAVSPSHPGQAYAGWVFQKFGSGLCRISNNASK